MGHASAHFVQAHIRPVVGTYPAPPWHIFFSPTVWGCNTLKCKPSAIFMETVTRASYFLTGFPENSFCGRTRYSRTNKSERSWNDAPINIRYHILLWREPR